MPPPQHSLEPMPRISHLTLLHPPRLPFLQFDEPSPLPLGSPHPPHPGKDKGRRKLNAVFREHHQAPVRLRGQQAAPVDTQDAVGSIGGHQQHRWRPEAAPHVVQRGVGAHCPDMKQVLGGPHIARDDHQRHLEHGVGESEENRIRGRHRAKEKPVGRGRELGKCWAHTGWDLDKRNSCGG